MVSIYENAIKEEKIREYVIDNNYTITIHLVTENAIMFSVSGEYLDQMMSFCKEQFGSCDIVEELSDDFFMCKVKT